MEKKEGKNSNLHQAKKKKNDEFYTQLSDIEKELNHYEEYFKDKVVFCNCDDPYESKFFEFFALNFKRLGLKKLITMWYMTSDIAWKQLPLFEIPVYKKSVKVKGQEDNKAYKIEISELQWSDKTKPFNAGVVKELIKEGNEYIEITPLTWDEEYRPGDFRSKESIDALKEVDIVVTNPPFSLFREYVAQLIEYDKKFLILWNMNAITYKEIFPLIKDNKLWIGYGFNLSMVYKTIYRNTLEANRQFVKQKGLDPDDWYLKVPGICRYTNFPHKKRYEKMDFYKKYTPEEFPHYDNYDAINIDKVAEIPWDYEGVMGVPITFLDKYNPDQFEIIDINPHFFVMVSQGLPKLKQLSLKSVGKKDPYARILIRRK